MDYTECHQHQRLESCETEQLVNLGDTPDANASKPDELPSDQTELQGDTKRHHQMVRPELLRRNPRLDQFEVSEQKSIRQQTVEL